ncbi:restriction endonuclease subunit S [Uliginosibacterium flavum]|uniref:Restriction endonuclease subunit S n=2 Tax=Uliginosibacterium flavum TaxID=1396831 RepID=A0ABV2TPL1_9RHOO
MVCNKPGVCSTDILVFRFKSETSAIFYADYFRTSSFNSEVLLTVVGQQLPRTSWESIRKIRVPAPNPDVQNEIVAECGTVDDEVTSAHASIAAASTTVERKIAQIYASSSQVKKLPQIAFINPSKTELRAISDDTLVSFVEMASVSEGGQITHRESRSLGHLRKGSYTYFAENDIIVAKITPCMENGKCALAQGLENRMGMGSTEFHVLRADPEQVLPAYLFALINRATIRNAAAKVMTGSSGHRRVPASFYENLEIPLPKLAEQRRIVNEIEVEQHAIAAAEAIIAAAPARKQAILQHYL